MKKELNQNLKNRNLNWDIFPARFPSITNKMVDGTIFCEITRAEFSRNKPPPTNSKFHAREKSCR